MESTYRLRRQTNRWARFAEVGVRVVPATRAEVVIGADVFGRRRSAAVDGGLNVDSEAEAREGAWYALRRLPEHAGDLLVEITAVVVAPADTGPGDVKFAAAHAVWQALGHVPSHPPFTGGDGSPVFPADGVHDPGL
ncbi:hypothetical protein [Streptomyces sp. NPDC005374]|uniref:hypothetical protein n=1 Tax=Streptomyces sp. NPDC005374 TaxID=3364713 RepID=UPI003687F7B5